MTSTWKRVSFGIVAAALAWGPAAAQEANAPALSLELNTLQPSEGGCRLTFVVENGLGADVSRAAFELVLFNSEGLVDRMTVVDFQDLPADKTKVRQFDFKGTPCDQLGRVLINDATDCAGDGIAPDACIRNLKTATKSSSVEFGS
jgi:hypothetical protein